MMTSWAMPLRLLAAGISLALAAACSSPSADDAAPEEDQGQEAAENPLPQPEYESDEMIRLPVALVSPAQEGQGRLSESEIARTGSFGCGNTLSIIETVPLRTEDPAAAALGYLFSLQSSSHARVGYANPLASSASVTVEAIEVDDDEVTVRLQGAPTSPGYCESWQILKQIETTARAATGAASARVLVDEVPLDQIWGLQENEPLAITELG